MSRLAAASLAITLLFATGCAQPRPGAPPGDSLAQLELRQAEFFAAVAARDADLAAALFAEAGVLHVANMAPIEGRDAIRPFYTNMFRFLSASSAVPESTEISASGDMAYTIGRTTSEFRGPEGTQHYTGKFALVWQRFGADWRIVLYSVSSN